MTRADLLKSLYHECIDARGRGFGERCRARIQTILDEIQRFDENLNTRKKICYIAGPYRAYGTRTVSSNIAVASAYAEKYWKLGYAVICPHMNSAHFDGIVDDAEFLAAGLEMVRRSDVVVAMHNWAESDGARREIELADELEIRVIYDDGSDL